MPIAIGNPIIPFGYIPHATGKQKAFQLDPAALSAWTELLHGIPALKTIPAHCILGEKDKVSVFFNLSNRASQGAIHTALGQLPDAFDQGKIGNAQRFTYKGLEVSLVFEPI